MRVLITGASGFVGRNMAQAWRGKYDISAPSHAELDLDDGAAVSEYFKNRSFDAVVHCAWKPGHRNAPETRDIYSLNTKKFFNLAKNSGGFGKLIIISSGLVYDIRAYQPKMKEDYFGAHIPADESGLAKYEIAKRAQLMPNAVELRPFGVYGKYEDYAIRFISNAICKTLFDLPVTIKQNRRFDYVHVDDLIYAAEHFLANPARHKSYNVTPDKSVELLELARLVVRQSGKDIPIKIAKDGMAAEYSGDNSRLRGELPEFPKISMESGIAGLYGWYRANKAKIDKSCLMFDK